MENGKQCMREGGHKGLTGYLLSWKGVVSTLALAGLSYYLLTVHLEHLAIALPYLFLLACPLMHIFMHGSHHHDGDTVLQKARSNDKQA